MKTTANRTYCDVPKSRQWHDLLSLYKDGFLCDVEFRVGNDKVAAHKIILCAATNYFQVMFQANFSECEKNVVDLSASFNDIRTLTAVLDYIYHGEIYLSCDTVLEVLDISVQFLLHELQGHCAQFLLERLQPQNVLHTWHVARLYDLRELEEISQTVAYATFCRKFIFSKSIDSLSATFLASFLQDTQLSVNSVDRIELVLLWLSFEFEERLNDAETLICDYLRYNPLPSTYSIEATDAFSAIDADLQIKLKNRFSGLISRQRHTLQIERISFGSDDDEKPEWCLMVQEEGYDRAAFYCAKSKTWFSANLFCEEGEVKGVIAPYYLVVVTVETHVCLVDLTNGSRKPASNVFRSLIRKNTTIAENTFDIFCHNESLYILMTSFSGLNRKPIFVIYRYDPMSDAWNFHMEINYDFFGDEMAPGDKANVSLRVRPGLSNHYLMVTVSTKRRIEIPQSRSGNMCSREYRFQELKNFHVISFDPVWKNYETCGVRWHEPVALDQCPAIILNDRICFLKMSDNSLLAEKFRLSFLVQEECYMDAVCLMLNDRTWERVTIGIPSPNLPRLPIRNEDGVFYKNQVANAYDKLLIGVQRAPHVYQIAMYNLDNFSAVILPPVSLPVARNPKLTVFSCRRRISSWVKDTDKYVDMDSFLFSDFTLTGWNGTRRVADKY